MRYKALNEDCIYDYIKSYMEKYKKAPTQQEIMQKFNIQKGTVKAALDRLALKGKITRSFETNGKQKDRSIKLESGEGDSRIDNPFCFDPQLRRKVKAIVSGYNSMKRKIWELRERDPLSRSNDMDGTPRGTDLSDTTANIAIFRIDTIGKLEHRVEAIEEARDMIDPAYRDAVWEYCTNKYANQINITMNYPLSIRTLVRYQTRFYWDVAKRLNMV